MIKYIGLVVFSILLFIISSCKTQDQNLEKGVCFSFDERQCGVDPFTAIGASNTVKENNLRDYLSKNGVELMQFKFVEQFHEIVCEACTICPEQHRFFIKISESNVVKIESLNLFNLVIEDCVQIF